jgi:hypothetical protein
MSILNYLRNRRNGNLLSLQDQIELARRQEQTDAANRQSQGQFVSGLLKSGLGLTEGLYNINQAEKAKNLAQMNEANSIEAQYAAMEGERKAMGLDPMQQNVELPPQIVGNDPYPQRGPVSPVRPDPNQIPPSASEIAKNLPQTDRELALSGVRVAPKQPVRIINSPDALTRQEIPPPDSMPREQAYYRTIAPTGQTDARNTSIETPAQLAERQAKIKAMQQEVPAPDMTQVAPQPAPTPMPEQPVQKGAGELYNAAKREKEVADAAKTAESGNVPAAVRKYAKNFDEAAAEAGYNLAGFGDPRTKAKQIIAQTKSQMGEDYFARTMGIPADRADLLAEKRIAVEIHRNQAKAREDIIKDVKERVKLEEMKNGPSTKTAQLAKLGAEGLKFKEVELEDSIFKVLGGKYGKQFSEALAMPDPAQRAAALTAILKNPDIIPEPVLNDRETMLGYILNEGVNKGEDLFKNRKTKGSKDKPPPNIPASSIEQFSSAKAAAESVRKQLASPQELDSISAGLKAIKDVLGNQVGAVIDQVATRQIIDVAGEKAGPKGSPAYKKARETAAESLAKIASIRMNLSDFLKSTSGLAVTDAEYQRIWASAPNETDPPELFKAKTEAFIERVENLYNTRLKTFDEAGYETGGLLPMGGPRPQPMNPSGVPLNPTAPNPWDVP